MWQRHIDRGMRATILAWFPLVICSAADPGPEKIAEPAVQVFAEMVNLNISQRFDETGKAQNPSSELRVTLALKPNGDRQLLACRGVQVMTAIAESGEVLRPRGRASEMGVESFQQHERERGDYDISLTFAVPAKAQGIGKLAGTIILAVASGAATKSELSPLKDFLGKALLLEGMDQPVTVTREEGRLTIRSTREAFERIDRISGQRANGQPIQFNGWGGGSDGEEYYRSYSSDVPDDGAVTITLLPAATEVTVPFSIGPVPLFAAPAPAQAETVRVPASKPTPAAEPNRPRVAPVPAGAGGF